LLTGKDLQTIENQIVFILSVKQTKKSTSWTIWTRKGRDLPFFALSVTFDWWTCRVPDDCNLQWKTLSLLFCNY